MSSENNAPKNIHDQVKNILSSIQGDFFTPLTSETGPTNYGHLYKLIIVTECADGHMHTVAFSPQRFLENFAGMHAKGYFENFQAIGMFRSGQKLTVTDLENRLKEEEQATDGLNALIEKVQKLADQAAIQNSHLKVENDCLRREIARLKAMQEDQPTETALDFEPVKNQKQSKFWAGIKQIIGE